MAFDAHSIISCLTGYSPSLNIFLCTSHKKLCEYFFPVDARGAWSDIYEHFYREFGVVEISIEEFPVYGYVFITPMPGNMDKGEFKAVTGQQALEDKKRIRGDLTF